MVKNRILNLQKCLNESQAFLIASHSNRFYVTNFSSSAGYVLITKTKALFFVDFRYFEKAKQVVDCDVILLDGNIKTIFDFLKSENIKCVFVETNHINISQKKRLTQEFKNIQISDDNVLDQTLNKMRAVKSEYELNLIKKAQNLTEQTFNYILPRITIGRTEKEIMLDMEFFMRNMGAEGVAFDFIVVSGKNSSLPHGVPTDKKIEYGDFVTMDFGGVVGGYCSDMTRTVAIGNVSDQQKTVYNTTLKAQLAALDVIKSGVVCGDVDKTARDIIYNAGYKGCFGHALGHSVGIDVHETPNLSPNNNSLLEIGNIVTVEPGIYIENEFGVRIEDMVYVTKDGYINLTKSKKELIVL